MNDHFRDLYTHMEWADERVWREVLQNRGYSEDDTLLDPLAHLHMVQHAFLDVWRERSVRQRDPRSQFTGSRELVAWARTFYPEARAFVATVDAGGLAQPCPLPWAPHFGDVIGRDPAVSTLGETLLQLALHSVHHRAQVVRQIRVLGGAPPMVDFIVWIWMGRPDPAALEE